MSFFRYLINLQKHSKLNIKMTAKKTIERMNGQLEIQN